jgi:phospholipid/cholesterol/gamma-HCH transport system substrate-binding protein
MRLRLRLADQIVGVFILIAILGLAGVVIFLGINQRWFKKNWYFWSEFKSGAGLSVGMSITLKGFEIGKVDSRALDPETGLVRIDFYIFDRFYSTVALENSIVELAQSPIGLGGGLLFHPGLPQIPPRLPLAEGSYIPTLDTDEGWDLVRRGLVDREAAVDTIGSLLSQVGPILDKMNTILFSLDQLVLTVEDSVRGDRNTQLGSLLYSTETLIKTLDGVFKGSGTGPVNDILVSVADSTDRLNTAINRTTKDLDEVLANLKRITENIDEMTSEPTGLVMRLIDPQGSIKTLLDDDNTLYQRIEGVFDGVDDIIAELGKFAQFVTGTSPQIASILEQGRSAISQGQDIMEALKNNPLLSGGIPERQAQPSTFKSYRDEEF